MCGRVRCQSKTSSTLSRYESLNDNKHANTYLHLSENILPGTILNVLKYCNQRNEIIIDKMIWGLIPSSYKQKDIKPNHFLMYNCRVENASQKISFKHLIQNNNWNKCVLVIDGYYEWKEEFGQKQPYYISTTTDTPLYLAGIYDTCVHNNEQLKTFTIFTMNSITNTMKDIHNRQPIFLSEGQIGTWLSPATDTMMFLQSYIDCSLSLSHSSSTVGTHNSDTANTITHSYSHFTSNTNSNTHTAIHTDDTNTDVTTRATINSICQLVPELHNICTNNIQYYPVTKQLNHASYQGSDCSIKCITKKQVKINDYFSVTPSPKKQKSLEGERDISMIDSEVGKIDSEGNICNSPNKKAKLYDIHNNNTTTTAILSSSLYSSSAVYTIHATSTSTNTQPSLVHITTVPTTLLSDTNTDVYYDRSPKNEASPSLHNNKNSDNTSNSSNNVCIQIDSIIDLTDD